MCHTDLHIVEGELATRQLPLIPGHQVVGVVDRVGEGVSILKPGDRAGLPWLHQPCPDLSSRCIGTTGRDKADQLAEQARRLLRPDEIGTRNDIFRGRSY
ncbi:MAG: alcohol dehydrogenase catalytic domain-containing protein [Chloroflexi bacterium]|nr:alcohol dehydrogenase catalytic domain-containing protein [Chloroflexota bacterium]